MEGVFIENLQKSKFIEEPFVHRRYSLFSNDLCEKLISNFFYIKKYMSQYDGISQSRFMICLNGDNINGIDYKRFEFLKSLDPLYNLLEFYNSTILNELNNCYNSNNNFKYQINLVFDSKSYEIGPHTDSYNRKVTNIVYLVSEKDVGKSLGVSLFKDLINRHENKWEKTHYSFDNFEEIDKIPYFSGSSVDFKVSNNSFHGIKSISDDCERMSIQSMIWK